MSFALMRMFPALPGPVVLAATEALFEMLTDCPATREIFPPAPASGVLPRERLKMPSGLPLLKVPDIEIVSRALIVISPPCPLPLVPLLICPPLPRLRNPALIDILPASPQGPPHTLPPVVSVVIPLGASLPLVRIEGYRRARTGNSPEIEMPLLTFNVTF